MIGLVAAVVSAQPNAEPPPLHVARSCGQNARPKANSSELVAMMKKKNCPAIQVERQ